MLMNNENSKPGLIYDLEYGELLEFLLKSGQPKFRADQIWNGLYRKFWNDPDQFAGVPGDLRKTLNKEFRFSSLTTLKELSSNDHKTMKYLFSLPDGNKIETVWMRYHDRNTLCISTQSGCAMDCSFCATGQMGFFRNLTSGEIIEQILFFARKLNAVNEQVTNIVFMGMGEPFHNYDNVMQSIDRINAENGYNFGARRITISTSGLVPQIKRFADEKRQVNLAISLHAVDDDMRSTMMLVNKRYPVDMLLEACHYYVQVTHRRISFEWALIEGLNDSEEIAAKFAKKVKGLICHVNLIPLNPTSRFAGLAAKKDRVEKFRQVLLNHGIPCTVRLRRGIDIKAGCGQLASEN
jgi:23S rRNA (adenine2503-C2)-methyltransferase